MRAFMLAAVTGISACAHHPPPPPASVETWEVQPIEVRLSDADAAKLAAPITQRMRTLQFDARDASVFMLDGTFDDAARSLLDRLGRA